MMIFNATKELAYGLRLGFRHTLDVRSDIMQSAIELKAKMPKGSR